MKALKQVLKQAALVPASTVIVGALWLAAAGPATADAVLNRPDLGATDTVDWGQFGLNSQFATRTFSSLLGSTGSVSSGSEYLSRLQQGAPGAYWQVNFTPGDQLLLSYSGVTIVSFAQAVAGVGTQWAYGFAYGAFDGVISAFDAGGNLLETHSRRGATNGNADGSAIYLGILRSQADIARVEFSTANTPPYGSAPAINRLDIVPASAIPEPGMAWMLLLGLPVLAWARRRGNGA